MTDSAETMRAHKHVTLNADGDIWTAGIDIRENNGDWHYSAVECHSVDRELAIARRDTVFAALSASGTKSDGGVESRHAKTGNMSGAVPEEEQSLPASGFVRAFGPEDKTSKPRDGVAPIPSDPIPSQPDERESIARLLTAAKLLQQNAIGCATNHHGHDCELNGLPGWLADTKKDIDAAEDAILAMQAERRGAKS